MRPLRPCRVNADHLKPDYFPFGSIPSSIQAVDGKLIAKLKEQFPDQLPTNENESYSSVLFRAGQVSVVRWLEGVFLAQQERMVSMELEGHY